MIHVAAEPDDILSHKTQGVVDNGMDIARDKESNTNLEEDLQQTLIDSWQAKFTLQNGTIKSLRIQTATLHQQLQQAIDRVREVEMERDELHTQLEKAGQTINDLA